MIDVYDTLDELISTPATLTRVSDGDEHDDYGEPEPASEPEQLLVARFPADADEIASLNLQRGDETVFIRPPSTSIAGTERLTIGDDTYSLVGPGQVFTDPTTGVDQFVQVHARRTA